MTLNIFETISLAFAALLIITRIAALISPNFFRSIVKKIHGFDCNLLALAGLLIAIFAIAIFNLLIPTVSFEIIITSIFGIILFGIAWLLVNNDIMQGFLGSMVGKSDTWVRVHAIFGIIIGITIIYIILYVGTA